MAQAEPGKAGRRSQKKQLFDAIDVGGRSERAKTRHCEKLSRIFRPLDQRSGVEKPPIVSASLTI
jgi:hypothetical protein